jgi:hypothetical protein
MCPFETRTAHSHGPFRALGHKMTNDTKGSLCAWAHKRPVLRGSWHQSVCGDWLVIPQARRWERCDIRGWQLHFAYCALSFLLMCLWFCVGGLCAHVGPKTKRCKCWRVMRLPRVPLARGQCPRGSRQRFVERLPSSRAEDWRLHAKAGCSPGYVGPNITPIMLPSHLCDVQHQTVGERRAQSSPNVTYIPLQLPTLRASPQFPCGGSPKKWASVR